MTNILEIMLSNILFKIWFRIKIKFKSDFEIKDIFEKWKAMILERLRRSFGFEFESSTKMDTFYSHYKSRAIHHYKNKCIEA
jgi:hypothetical protein